MNKKIAWAILFVCIVGTLVFGVLFVWKSGRLPFVAQKRVNTVGSVASATCAPSTIDLFGQTPDADRAKNIASLLDRASRDIFKAHQVYQKNQSEENAQQLRNLAVTRKNLLAETLQRDSDAAFFSLLSREESDVLSALTSGCVEVPTTIEGLVETGYIDLLDGSAQKYYMLVTENGERLSLFPARGADAGLVSGVRVAVSGYRLDDMVIFDGSNTENVKIKKDILWWMNTASAAIADAMGDQKTAVLLVNFQNTAQPSVTKATVQDLIFNQTNNYFNEVSYGKTSFSGDIFGWYTIPIDQTCDTYTTWSKALNVADPDVNFTQYSRLVIIAPFGPSCAFGGQSTIGRNIMTTSDGVVRMSRASLLTNNLTLSTIGHELGHGLGVRHASFLDCGAISSASSGCTKVEYDNHYSIMGGGTYRGHFDALHKEYIGWFDAPNITTVTANGTYVLAPLETVSSGLQALKIQRGQNAYLFAEYRQPIGVDATFSNYTGSDVFQGALVVVHELLSQAQSFLIDTTPPANNKTTAVLVGQTFTDPASGASITVTGKTSAALTVNVALGKTDFDPPTVSITSPQDSAIVSGTITVSADAADASGIEKVEFYKDCIGTIIPFATDTTAPYQASLDTTQIQDGNIYVKAVAYDLSGQAYNAPGNSATQCSFVTVLNGSDVTPPTISVVTPADGTTVSNPVSFQSIAGDDRGIQTVEFYKDGESVPFMESNTGVVSATLSSGAHTFFARARDIAGNTTDSSVISFTVSGGADTVAPTVSLTSPAAGATVLGATVALSATAFDTVAVAGVQFKVDGVTIGAEDTVVPYSAVWNSTTATNGSHTITATARDAAGNTTVSSGVTVTVNNATADAILPTVSLTAPAAGATVSGSTTLSATAADNAGVQKVDFYRDASVLLGTDTTSPYSFAWDTAAVLNGTHTFFARAYDTSNNQATTFSRSVTVSNTIIDSMPPTNPTAVNALTTTSSSQATLSWSPSVDDISATSYRIYRNNTQVGISATTTYTDTGLSSSTTYTYTIRAVDTAGNLSGASVPITVTTSAVSETSNIITAKGVVSVTVVASSNAQLTKVEFYQDTQTTPFTITSSAPFVAQWNTTSMANGNHVVRAQIYFADGTVTTSRITLNMQN